MKLAIDDLPRVMRDIVEAIGLAATVRLVEEFGGLVVFVPRRYHEDHALAKAIGARAAEQLVQRYAGDRLYVPKCDHALRVVRDIEISRRYVAGTSVRVLAREHRMSERNIWNILKRPETLRDDAQADLFD